MRYEPEAGGPAGSRSRSRWCRPSATSTGWPTRSSRCRPPGAERRRTVVVALDEFQAIDGFNGGSVEHALRAAAQQQRQVGYVFAGSEPSLMEKMIGPRGRSTRPAR